MSSQAMFLLGQGLGIVAVITGFLSYQMKHPRGILILQFITSLAFLSHYLLLGAPTAAALNVVGAVGCVCYYLRDRRGGGRWMPALFSLLLLAIGVLTWEGTHAALLILGLVLNNIALSFSDPQNTRRMMLIKSPLCIVYNIFVLSVGGIIYESAVLISAISALLRHRAARRHGGDDTSA